MRRSVVLDFDRDAILPSEQVIYRAFVDSITNVNTVAAAIRAAKRCGVSRTRVWEVVTKLNPELNTPIKEPHHYA